MGYYRRYFNNKKYLVAIDKRLSIANTVNSDFNIYSLLANVWK